MFQLTIEREFCAAHSILIRGEREPVHGHNWCVRAVIEGETLDGDGLLVDFHHVERAIDAIIQPLHNRSLNEITPFNALNPTAEHVARFLAESLEQSLQPGVRVHAVSVTEAPGCTATWLAD